MGGAVPLSFLPSTALPVAPSLPDVDVFCFEYCSKEQTGVRGCALWPGWGLEGRHGNRGSPTEMMGKLKGRGGPPRPGLCQGKGLGSLPLRVGSRLGICLGEGTPSLGPQPASPHPRPQLVLPRKLPLVGPPGCSPAPPSNSLSTQTRSSPLDLQSAWTWAGPPLRQVNNATFISLCQ